MKHMPFLELRQLQQQFGPDFILHAQKQYGDLFMVHIPLMPRLVFALHPNHNYELLVRQASKVGKPALIRRAIGSSFGNGLFSSDGELWRQQRKLMQPSFQHGRIAAYASLMVEQTQNMLTKWQDGQILFIDEAMHALTFTIVVAALFSGDASQKTDHISQAMTDLGQGLTAQSLSPILGILPDWAPHPVLRQKRRGANALKQAVTALITERRQLGEANSPIDLLSTLMFSRDATTNQPMSDQQLQDELVTLFIAGHETTAVLMDWVWVMLSHHPEVEARLHTELDGVLQGRLPIFSDLPHLPYTGQVIKETLRLFPPAWFIFRQTIQPLSLDDWSIPKGAICFLFPYAVQRDGRWYGQPEQFQPERWTENGEQSLPKGAYLPFGMGARVCIGNGFAQMEGQLLLATIAQQYRLEALDQPRVPPGATTLSFAKSVRVQLHKRNGARHRF